MFSTGLKYCMQEKLKTTLDLSMKEEIINILNMGIEDIELYLISEELQEAVEKEQLNKIVIL